MSNPDVLPSPSPSPLYHCDYSDWSPSLFIIPSVYLLAFLLGCLGNGLVLWVYLDRAEGRRLRHKQKLSSFCCPTRSSNETSAGASPSDSFGQTSKSNEPSGHHPSPASRPSRSLTDSLIASLAMADLCFLVTLPLWAVYTALGYHWLFGQPLCQISSFLTALNMYASVFSLSALSLERYWVLTGRRPSSRQPAQRCASRACRVLGGVWALAGILALPGLLLRSVREVDIQPDPDNDWQQLEPVDPRHVLLSCQMDYSILIGAELDDIQKERMEMLWAAALSIKSTLFGFLLPFVILLVCYCNLAQLLSRHFGRSLKPDRLRQRRLLRVIVTLVMAFFVCWLPLHVNKTLAILLEFGFVPYSCSLDQSLLAAHPYVTCLAYMNSCLNPLLYAACDPTFRRRCNGVLLGLCGAGGRKEEGAKRNEEEEKENKSSTFPMGTQEETAGRLEEARGDESMPGHSEEED